MDELIIEPRRAEKNYWRDLWRYRELFYFLAWRDILVRYKQTAIGVAWAVIRPYLTMMVLVVVFRNVAKLQPPSGVDYHLLVMAALLPWQFFSTSLSESSNSLIMNTNLVSKVYFPRMIVPAGSVITSFVDFLINAGLMAILMVWYKFAPDWHILLCPFFVVIAFAAAFGVGLWLCALSVDYRDFRYIVPFVVQFGLYITPVGFTSDTLPAKWLPFYALNPMVGVVDGFRWALLRGQCPLNFETLGISIIVTVFLCLSGIWYFRKMERTFADVI